MTNGEMVIAFATLMGPIAAVQAQKWIERSQARGNRKRELFKALISNRGSPFVSPLSVQALNMVEIEFGGTRFLGRFGRFRRTEAEEAVLSAWAAFFAHANNPANSPRWAEQFNDLMNELLAAIGRDVGYDLKTSDLKWHTYSPQGHMQDEIAGRALRDSMTKVFTGERVLPVEVRLPGTSAGGMPQPETQQGGGK